MGVPREASRPEQVLEQEETLGELAAAPDMYQPMLACPWVGTGQTQLPPRATFPGQA